VVPLKEDLALIGVFPTAEEVKVCYQKIQDKFTGPGKRKSALLEALQDVCIKRKIDYWTVIDPLSSTANYQEMTLSALLKVYENKDSSDYEKSSAAKAIKDQCGKDGAALKNLADAFNGFKVVRSMMNLFSAHVYPSGMSQIVVMINEERSAADVLLALKNLAATKNKDIYKAFSGLVPRYSETQKAYDDINKFFNQGAQGQVLLTEDSGLMESEDETHGSSNQHRTMEDLIDKIKEAQSNTINTPAKTHV